MVLVLIVSVALPDPTVVVDAAAVAIAGRVAAEGAAADRQRRGSL